MADDANFAPRSLRQSASVDLARWFDFQSAGSILVLIVLAVLVVIPLLIMLLASVRPAGVMPFAPARILFTAYAQAYGGSDLLPIIRNTLIYAGLGVLFALPIAFGFAFLTERTDMPLRNAMYVLMFIPMSTPVFATALGWVLLLGPRGGTINVYLRAFTGSDAAEGPFNIYSLAGSDFRSRPRHGADHVAVSDRGFAAHGPGARRGGVGRRRRPLACVDGRSPRR